MSDINDPLELMPQRMSRRELVDAVKELARQHRQALGKEGDALLTGAADRLHEMHLLRDALCDRVAEIERLRAELKRLRDGPPGDDLAAVALWRRAG